MAGATAEDDIIAAIEAPRDTYRLVGHDDAADTISQAWDSGRFHHAWLISGPKGIGKATLAWAAARFMLAGGKAGQGATAGLGPLAVDPDHPQSRLLAGGGHPDCRLVRRSINDKSSPPRVRGEIAVGDVRALVPFFRQTSTDGGWRIAVVDAADEMNLNAANALLKMLEEPPARAALFLVAHAPDRLLPTIRSRCRKLRLHGLDEAQSLSVIEPLLADMTHEDLLLLARLGEGSPGRAVGLAAAGGAQIYRTLMRALATLPDLDEGLALELADQFGGARAGDGFGVFTDLMVGWLARLSHDVAVRAKGGDITADLQAGRIDAVETMLNQRLAATGGPAPWLDAWDKTQSLIAQCRGLHLDTRQVILELFFTLAEAAASH